MENQTVENQKKNRRHYYSVVRTGQNDKNLESKEWNSLRDINKYLSGLEPNQIVGVYRGKMLELEFKKSVTIR